MAEAQGRSLMEACGENGTGEQLDQRRKKLKKQMPDLTRTDQDSPELTQEALQIAYELAEPLFRSLSNT